MPIRISIQPSYGLHRYYTANQQPQRLQFPQYTAYVRIPLMSRVCA